MGAESKIFTYSDVSAHNNPQDCWVIINGKVYNVTSYLNEHPGGDDVLLGQAGKDGSEEFEDVGHGSAARLMLDEFYVGEIDPNTKNSIKMTNPVVVMTKNVKDKSTYTFLQFLVSLAIIGLGLGVLLFNFSS
ncbi:hypothetical protein ACS0TY_023045 [Phlomoides rotata]